MAVILDLDQLPYQKVLPIIAWCHENGIDQEKCEELIEAWTVAPPPEIDWKLTIPEKYATILVLKFL